MDRGLTGTMISLLRLSDDSLNANLGAGALDKPSRPEAQSAKNILSDRAWKVKNEAAVKHSAEGMMADRLDRWAIEAGKPGRRLGY